MVAVTDRREFRDLASGEELAATIDSLELEAGTERASLENARGRVLAERITAEIDVPGFDRAAMDGYAVRAGDTVGAGEASPVELTVAGTLHAGENPTESIEAGEAIEISTGAVLPPGADAVVVVEATSERGDNVAIRDAVTPGKNVMPAGADVAAGRRVLGPKTRLTPREIGLLSAIGCDAVTVRKPPTVGIISTGDELVRPDDTLDSAAGQIHDVNSYTIAAAVEEAGGRSRVYPHVGDDEGSITDTLTQAATECDLVLSSGSTSASTMDVIYRVIEHRGELLLHGTAVKPGKPTIVGEFEDAAYIGLPGYPVSALTIFRVFVAPAIRAAAGLPERRTATVEADMATRARFEEGRRRFLPVALVEDGDGRTLAYPVDKGSGATTTLVDADGVVDVDAQTAYLDPDESVTVELFSADAAIPSLLGAGEGDPHLWDLLDQLDRPRYLAEGSQTGIRLLEDGVTDVAVIAGPIEAPADSVVIDSWEREWGLAVPTGNPDDVIGLDDLIDGDLLVATVDSQWGLAGSFDAAIGELANSRDEAQATLQRSLRTIETRSFESPARRVVAGDADAGVTLAETAADLDVTFVSLGTERVEIVAASDRVEKTGIQILRDRLASE